MSDPASGTCAAAAPSLADAHAIRRWWALAGHPPGLTIVILTGLWEVFALAGMRAILIFYLVKQLAYGQTHAAQVYSLSIGSSFMMTLIGALIADRWLGVQRAVLVGALLMTAGLVALPASSLFYPALLLTVLGSGLLKPSLVALIGPLYSHDDARRDRAFVLYKAGCNAGAIFSPILCGALGELYGWTWGLAACGAGMIVSVIIFVLGRQHVREVRVKPRGEQGPHPRSAAPSITSLAPLGLALCACVLFFAAHGQQGATIALWLDGGVERTLHVADAQFVLPAAWFQSLNPIVIVLATPIVNWLWTRRAGMQLATDQLRKMRWGSALLTLSFCVLAMASVGQGTSSANLLWPCAALVLLAVGELYFDAIGQAFVLRHAGRRSLSTLAGVWFAAQALGYVASGWLADAAWGPQRAMTFFALMAVVAAASAGLIAVAGRAARNNLDEHHT